MNELDKTLDTSRNCDVVSDIFSDVVAFVDVRSQGENRAKGISKQLVLLGAKVVEKINAEVTHVIWKDGKKSTRDIALKKGLPLVSVLWVESCRQNGEHVSEDKFPIIPPEDSPLVKMGLGKVKRMKCMEPKSLEEDLANSAERNQRKWKRAKSLERQKYLPFSARKTLEKALVPGLEKGSPCKSGQPASEPGSKDGISRDSFDTSSSSTFKRREVCIPAAVASDDGESFPKKRKSTFTNGEPGGNIKKGRTPISGKMTPSLSRVDSSATTMPYSNMVTPKSSRQQDIMPTNSAAVVSSGIDGGNSTSTTTTKKSTLGSMVMTSMNEDERDITESVVCQLGNITVDQQVGPGTTHIVCGDSCRRTLSLLMGIVRGCWLLTYQWVLDSLEASCWLDEEIYQVNKFPAAKNCRAKSLDLFSSLGSIFLADDTSPGRDQLVLLVELAGGQVCQRAEQASLHVGRPTKRAAPGLTTVNEKWVLDCITELKTLSIDNYLLK